MKQIDMMDVIGCSAEGHIRHILSDRLSGRPWDGVKYVSTE